MYNSIGQVGYEKWRSMLEPHATAGLPDWNKLPKASQAAWEEVAQTIVDAHSVWATGE